MERNAVKKASQDTCLAFSLTALGQVAVRLKSPAEHVIFRLHHGSLEKKKSGFRKLYRNSNLQSDWVSFTVSHSTYENCLTQAATAWFLPSKHSLQNCHCLSPFLVAASRHLLQQSPSASPSEHACDADLVPGLG